MLNPPARKNERWRPVVGWEDRYRISSQGRLWLVITGRMATPLKNDRGYLVVTFWRDNKTKTASLHRIMAVAFLPNPEGKKTVNHKNGIKTDNRLENLEWMTHAEQQRHKVDVLHKGCGATGGGNKLTAEQVLAIRAERPAGRHKGAKTYLALGRKYGVHWRTVWEVVSMRSWRYV